ncbi:tetratricopeptide repeat protein [Rubinisphaera sp. JC750]|uniref:tetratricopeptide repeat protein n=1 Tax=Rubinisphaera sp. JC750 TaxID=2898658 RepID=UPI001F2BF710|nr:tetratricopeptide repeat protein [Rubinisphaera sp. JC750]
MSQTFQRAHLLFSQKRYQEALAEVGRHLAEQPHEPYGLALRGQILAELDRKDEALSSVYEAIANGPDNDYVHFAHGYVLLKSGKSKDAEAALLEAIRLAPDHAEHYSLLAATYLDQSRWNDALKTCDAALELDPDDERVLNLKSMALRRLRRKEESQQLSEEALRRNPEDPMTHANRGWQLLEAGKHEQALEHFKEALRLDPDCNWARMGIVDAMKARHRFYRWMLGYFFWMSNFTPRARWIIVLGAWFGIQILSQNSEALGSAEVLVAPIIYLYLAFVLSSWLAGPFFSLVLRLDPHGRLALDRREKHQANALAACLVGVLGFLIAFAVTLDGNFLVGTVWSAVIAIPATTTFTVRKGWPRLSMAALSLGLAAALFTHVSLRFSYIEPQLNKIIEHREQNAAEYAQASNRQKDKLDKDKFSAPVIDTLREWVNFDNRMFTFLQFGVLASCFAPAVLPPHEDHKDVDVRLT